MPLCCAAHARPLRVSVMLLQLCYKLCGSSCCMDLSARHSLTRPAFGHGRQVAELSQAVVCAAAQQLFVSSRESAGFMG